MAKIKTLKDSKNETIYPITVPDAVIDTDGNQVIEQLKEKIDKTDTDDTLTVVAAVSTGNVNTYRATMRQWFRDRLSAGWTSADLTALCDKWYTITRTGWSGGTEFYGYDVSAVSTGTRVGDSRGLTCVPSTDTVKNQDDFEGLPLFAIKDCNWIVDVDTLEPVITAIDGITDNFVRDDPNIYVGVLQMAPYHYWVDNDNGTDNFIHGVTDTYSAAYTNIEPVPEAVRVDGTMRPWVVHAKYSSKTVSNKMTCCSGVIPTGFNSHNSLHTLSAKNGKQYSGGTTADHSWLILMAYVKYASLTLDGILQGCCNYGSQYPAAIGESGVKRILLTAAQAANLIVGSSVILGNYNNNLDRGVSAMSSITTTEGARIEKIETVTVNDTQYSAVYIDTTNTFNTVANGAKQTGTTYISTWHWQTGTCDTVRGNDGSPVDCTSGKYPARLQGIEYMSGGYDVLADVIIDLGKGTDGTYIYRPYVVTRSGQQTTSITSNYRAAALSCAQPASSKWCWIKHLSYANGMFYPRVIEGNASSSTYTRDAFYMSALATGTREMPCFGILNTGSSIAGLSCLNGIYDLSYGVWQYLARLSPTGNRGEFTRSEA